MLQEVFMPKLGDTVEEATIEVWHKKEGDEIAKGEVLLEVTTDKATLEVESLVSGTLLKILSSDSEEIPVGQVIAYVGAYPNRRRHAGQRQGTGGQANQRILRGFNRRRRPQGPGGG